MSHNILSCPPSNSQPIQKRHLSGPVAIIKNDSGPNFEFWVFQR